tara:strand:+ start:181 stop:2016 length:1836 start_codon:yes stop_codon:yes gene_type:complete
VITLEKLIEKKILNIFYLSIFYLLLNRFGFNDSQSKFLFLQFFTVFIFSVLVKKGVKVFYIINFLFLIYYFLTDNITFTLLFFQILFFTLFHDFDLKLLNNIFKIKNIDKHELLSYIFIFVLTLATQNQYLNFEILDHDVSTSILVANDIFNGYLPYERLWDDKQPLFYIFNYIVLFLSKSNYLFYKIFFDIFTFANAIIIFLIVYRRNNQTIFIGITSSSVYLFVSSQPWANSEYSEIMSLTFLGLSYFLTTHLKFSKYRYLFSGIFFSISTLINIGTGIFSIGFLILFLLKKQEFLFSKIFYFSLGFIPIHLSILFLYALNGLTLIYTTTLITIPFSYTSTDTYFFYDLRVFIESLFQTSPYLSSIFLFLLFNIVNILNRSIQNKFRDYQINAFLVFLILAFGFLYLAGKGYYHHFLYVVFFLSISLSYVNIPPLRLVLFFSILMFSIFNIIPMSKESAHNIIYSEFLFSEYPLYNLSQEIDELFINNDYSILGLDNLILLFYLNKPNDLFIIHPTNHNENFIVNNLIKANIVKNDYLEQAIEQRPNVVVCSTDKNGEVYYDLITNSGFLCTENTFKDSYLYDVNQDIFNKSQFYYDENKINKIIISNR